MLNLLAIPTVITIGTFNVALIDLIVLGLLLIALIVGLIQGFAKQIFSILGWVAAVVLGVIFCKDVAALLNEKIPALYEGIYNWLNEIIGLEGVITGEQTVEQILVILKEQTQIPEFLHQAIAQAVVDAAGEIQITQIVTEWAIIAISFLAIFIVSFLVFGILKAIFKALTKKIKIFGAIDRLLGALFAILKMFVVLILVTMLLTSLFPASFDALLHPVLESGEEVVSIFNNVLHAVMESQVVKDIFNSIIAGTQAVA